MDTSAFYPGKYLKAIEIAGRQIPVKIERLEREEMEGSGEFKPVLYFENKAKGVVLNKTNLTELQKKWGMDSDAWVGQAIVLTTTKVKSPHGGGLVDGFAILFPSHVKQIGKKPLLQTENLVDADLDDEIPF